MPLFFCCTAHKKSCRTRMYATGRISDARDLLGGMSNPTKSCETHRNDEFTRNESLVNMTIWIFSSQYVSLSKNERNNH